MKKMFITLALAFLAYSADAKTVKTTFEVKGNCGMCQKRIESAAKAVKGVTSARWNKNTGSFSLVYDDKQTSPEKVQKVLSEAGHDAAKFKASDAVYNKLPGCCKYRGNAKKH